MMVSERSRNAITFVRTVLKGQHHLTMRDVIAQVPEGMSRDSVRFATLQLLRSGEVDLSDDQRLFLTATDVAAC
jgi:hypothetical protein